MRKQVHILLISKSSGKDVRQVHSLNGLESLFSWIKILCSKDEMSFGSLREIIPPSTLRWNDSPFVKEEEEYYPTFCIDYTTKTVTVFWFSAPPGHGRVAEFSFEQACDKKSENKLAKLIDMYSTHDPPFPF